MVSGVFALLICLLLPGAAAPRLPLQTDAAILVEQTTGRVLYERNMNRRMYPASMTKLLTALVVLDYLDPDDVIIVGPEIRNMPPGYVTGVHLEGEHITVRILLKSLLIRSANESARVLALNAVRVRYNRPNIGYIDEAKGLFSALMNEKARELGALGTNFTNPYGLHDERHYTTAYDMALIARAFMDNPSLAQIVGMRVFAGDGLEGRHRYDDLIVQEFNWTNTNQMLPDAPHGHPFVTGIRTGYTTPAGECFAASAYHNGMALISVVFDSESPGRWQDTRRLLDFGFANFAFQEITGGGELSHALRIDNPRLGEGDLLTAFSQGTYTALLSHEEYATLTRVITYDPLLLTETEDDGDMPRLRVPIGGIEEGDILGLVAYQINGDTVFTSNIYAAHSVAERTFDSDMDYYIQQFRENVFSRRGLPYWFGAVGTLFGIIGVAAAINANRKSKTTFPRYRGYGR
jgi:D-alanyl-D-alanine carboxypeptidase (penicillin-binding protein 5/6)